MGYLIGIDAGTTALKAGVFDADGATLAVATEEYRLVTPAADRVELDSARYWGALIGATGRALEGAGVRPADVEAISVSSQGETVTPVAADGTPLGPSIVWLDNRARAEAVELASRFDAETVYAATGVPDVNPTWPACKILWWSRHEPDLFARTARFLLVEDLLLHRLTGRFVSEGGILSTTLLYDIRSGGWWPPMLDALGLGPERLPEIAAPGTVVGLLRPQAAESLGLRPGVRVVAGGMDQGVGAVGVGNVAAGIVSESTGGALTLQASIDRSDGDRTRRTPVYVHSAPGQYLYCPVCPTGGMVLTWFRDQFAAAEVSRAAAEGLDAYDLLTALAATVPAGSDGLTMLPHLAGAFSPEYEPRARGVWSGFTLAHGKGHFVRAILEAVAYMLRRNLELLADAGSPADVVRSHGGGARSDLWCQIKADVTDRPVVTLMGEHSAIRGNAMLAGVAAGVFANLGEACAAMVVPNRRFEPAPSTRTAYDAGYQRYRELFEALRPSFATLRPGHG